MLYEISGNQDAPVILMFPGSFGSARNMQGYMDLLKEKYYVIGVTLDGCDGSGNSYTSKDDVTDNVLQKVKGLRKAYPQAHYRDMSKYGHAMYCIMDPESYVKDIEKIIRRQ